MYPFDIPDLSAKSALIVSGRYQGSFPETVKARGILADMSNFSLDLKVHEAKDIPLEEVRFELLLLLIMYDALFSYFCW